MACRCNLTRYASPYYSSKRAREKQIRMTNYYDLGNPVVAAATISSVTAGEVHDSRTLAPDRPSVRLPLTFRTVTIR